VSECFTQC